MKNRATVALLCVIGALAAPAASRAVTLVNTSGQPIGGYLQRWANQAQVPTISSTLQIVIMPQGGSDGCAALACSSSPRMYVWSSNGVLYAPYGPDPAPITYLSPFANSWDLWWELGHQFDWALLTDTQRASFAALWHSTVSWWDSYGALVKVSEDGLEAQFAGDYADCAAGDRVFQSWVLGAHPSPRVCQMIDQIGAADAQTPPHRAAHHRRYSLKIRPDPTPRH